MKFSEFFIFLKVIDLRGNFEALNYVFSQSKPTKIKCTKVHCHYSSKKITRKELFNELLWAQNRARMGKL
jgi:hypothetical protein